MRLLIAIVATLVSISGTAPRERLPAEAVADSLYDAGAIDSLFAFSARQVERARASRDSVLLGRMTCHRGRARLALRDPAAPADLDAALRIATALGDSLGRMHALGLKAFVSVNQGRFDESIALNEERIALARALRRRGSEGWGHMLIGYAEIYRENYARSITEYEEAWRAFGDAARPREQLSASIGLARALERTGRIDDARTSYQRAWLSARELGDRGQEADAINNLGGIEMEHGDVALAADYFDRAYHIKRDIKAFDIANTARNVALVDEMIGRYAHAESTLVEAMAMSTEGMLDVAVAVEVGRLRMAQGRIPGATQCFRQVLAKRASLPRKTRIEAASLLADALVRADSVPAAMAVLERELPDPLAGSPSIWRAEGLLALAQCLRESQQPARARDMARAAWEDATARGDSSLIVFAASEASICARALGDTIAALDWLERARSSFEASRQPGDFQWREARRDMLARELLRAGDILREHPGSLTPDARHRAHFDFLQQVHARTLLERVADPRRSGGVDPVLSRPVTSYEIQRDVLKPGECLFAVMSGEQRVYVFAITRDEFRARVIEDASGALTARLRNHARLGANPVASLSLDTASRSLGDRLIGELGGVVSASTTLYVVLDGALAGCPFEILFCPGKDAPLAMTHRVVRVPSAALLRYLRARETSAPEHSAVLAVASAIPALAGTRDEVAHLASRYGAHRSVDPDRAALLDAFSRFDVIHVASHVHVDRERPWNSGIQIRAQARPASPSRDDDPLALSARDSTEIAAGLPVDPFLRASEIAGRRVGARLVVLSACESALGRAAFAEGVPGLSSSFLSAGSRAVVASLWDVDDRATRDFMRHFYRGLETGQPVADALRRAQGAAREDRPEPFYWAGFVVIGDGDVTVALEPRSRRAPVLGLALGGLVVAVSIPWVIWRRRTSRVRMAS